MERPGAPSIEMTTLRPGAPEPASSVQVRNGLLLAGAALAYFALGLPLSAFPLGPRAAQMGAHILLMNVLAPLLALAAIAGCGAKARAFASGRVLAAATALQLLLLWAWHAPNVLTLAMRQPAAHAIMQASLLTASLAFWLAILSEEGASRWRGVVAILFTGKLSCLLGVLLLFAPRLLDSGAALGHGHAAFGDAELLADQRLAGLLMLLACPLCYVLSGVMIAAKWLRDLERGDAVRRPAFSIPVVDVSAAPR